MNPAPRVLLVGLGLGSVAADTPRLFRAAGCRVSSYCPARSWLLKGRQLDSWHEAPERADRFAEGLESLLRREQYDWVVPTDDDALRALADHASPEVATVALPVIDASDREAIGGKAALSDRLHRGGVPTPEFAVYESDPQAIAAAERIGFPVLLKVDRSGGGRGVRRCESAAEMAATLRSLSPEQKQRLVVQRYVPGDIVAVEALYRRGAPIAAARAKVLRNATPDEFGVSAVREYEPCPSIDGAVTRIGEALGIDGFASLTFMRDAATGEHLAIEADLRPHTWFWLSRFAGVDFAEAVKRRLAGGDPLPPQPARRVEVRHWGRDFGRALAELDFRNLAAWAGNVGGRWRFVPGDEPRLLGSWAAEIAKANVYRFAPLRPLARAIKRVVTYAAGRR